MEYADVSDFLRLGDELPVVDVRSPAEFDKGHVSSAHSIPLFHDAERAIVGTIYKQKGKKYAIEKGLEIAGPKMLALAKQAEDIAKNGKLCVYCWRGGMRSNRMAWLFEQVGLQCTLLEGGYKSYRNTVLKGFDDLQHLIVIAGPTGSGKTDVLHAIKEAGEQVLDLEGVACHKGSAFGSIGMEEQPTSQQFQNDLFSILRSMNPEKRIWTERESMTIGKVYLSQSLWDTMNRSAMMDIGVPQEFRINRLVRDYGQATREELELSIRKLEQNLGGKTMKEALALLDDGKRADVAAILLKYYDKGYAFNREKYAKQKPISITLSSDDPGQNARKLISIAEKAKL